MPRPYVRGPAAPRRRVLLQAAALVGLVAAGPAAAELELSRFNRFFEGRQAILMVHGDSQQVPWATKSLVIQDLPDPAGLLLKLEVRVTPGPGPGPEPDTFAERIVIPQLPAGPSRLVVEGIDYTGFRTTLLDQEFAPEPPLVIAPSARRLRSTETLRLLASFTAASGSFSGGWEVVGDKLRVGLHIGCSACPIPLPIEHFELESPPIGPLPPGEYVLQVVDPEASPLTPPYHEEKIAVLPDPVLVQNGRFTVDVLLDPPHGGRASLVAPPSRDSALFYFFSPANWEVMVKVLDGCAINGNFWVYGAASTDVGYTVEVRDLAGAGRVRRYHHDAGTPAPAITDGQAFPCEAAREGGLR
jgi:hypothetical protein